MAPQTPRNPQIEANARRSGTTPREEMYRVCREICLRGQDSMFPAEQEGYAFLMWLLENHMGSETIQRVLQDWKVE